MQGTLSYRICLIKRTVRVEVGKIFCGKERWQSSVLPHTSMIVDRRVLAVIAPLRSRCSVSLDVCSYNPACEKIVNWSIV